MSKNYPSSWGQPPKIQTHDIVSLPLGGMGSSTLRKWQIEKIKEFGKPTTSQSGTNFTGTNQTSSLPTPDPTPPDRPLRRRNEMPSPDGSHLGPDGWKTPRQPIRSPIRPGGEDWLNGTVGTPWQPSQNFANLYYGRVRPSSPVDGINFDNKKELNKQLAKLDQDLRNARAQKDGSAIQRFEAKQQAANDVLKAMKAGYSASEAKEFAAREAKIRSAQQRFATPPARDLQSSSENAGGLTMPPSAAPSSPNKPAPSQASSAQLNTLASEAASGGKAGDNAMSALQQRAAAGDPQALNILKNLNLTKNSKPSEYIPAGQPVPGKPGSVADGKGGWSYPNQGNSEIKSSKPSDPSKTDEPPTKRSVSGEKNPATIQNPGGNRIISSSASPKKEPTAEEMAAQIDKQNRAREMAAQAAAQREAARKAAENQAARDSAARKMGFPDAAAAEKAGIKIGNIGENVRAGINSVSGGGSGRGRGGGLTAKERNDLADKRAAEAARREDRGGLSDSAYDQKQRDAQWKNTPKLSDPKNQPSVPATPELNQPSIPQIGSSASASTGGSGQGDASGKLKGWLKRRKEGLV